MGKRKREKYLIIYLIMGSIFLLIISEFLEKGNFKIPLIIAFIIGVIVVGQKNGVGKKITRSLDIYNRGIEGEERVRKCLKKLKYRNILLNDLNLEVNGYKSQIDHLLITNKCIFNIETKNYSGIIFVDDNGKWIQQTKYKQNLLDDTLAQVKRHRSTLQKILHNNYNIHDIIVIADNKTGLIVSKNTDVPVVGIEKLNDYIINVLKQTSNKGYNIEEIKELIENSKENAFKVILKKIKYFINDNKPLTFIVGGLIAGVIFIASYKPGDVNIDDNINSSQVIAINEMYYIDELKCNIEINDLTKTAIGAKLDVQIQNYSNDSITLGDMKFILVDNSGKSDEFVRLYDSDSVGSGESDNFQYSSIGVFSELNYCKLKIVYNDYPNTIEKEFEL